MLAFPLRLRPCILRPGILSKPSWPAPASYRPFSTTNSTLNSAAMSQAVEIPRPEAEVDIPEDEARRKRVKIGDSSRDEGASATVAADDDAAAQALKEAEVGITGFVSAVGSGFVGIVKKRCVWISILYYTVYDGDWIEANGGYVCC